MAFYLLTPLNLGEPDWALSVLRSPVQVNAEEESQARHAAAEQLCTLRGRPLALHSFPRPWLRRDRAACLPLGAPEPDIPLIEGYHPRRQRGRPSKQHLYLLTPVSLDSPHWVLSLSTEAVCVSARTPSHARAVAAMHFDVPGSAREDLVHPWWDPRLVSVAAAEAVPPGMRLVHSHNRPGSGSPGLRLWG